MPIYEDFYGIVGAIRNGYWKKNGIHSWNDLLIHIFGEVHRNEWDYSDEKLLEKISNKLRDFKNLHGRLPILKDKGMYKINEVIRKGLFKEEGITTCSELLIKIFGKANSQRNKYIGKKGLQEAIKEIKKFYNRNKKIPTSLDMTGLYKAIQRGEWIEYHIKLWDDILIQAYEGMEIYPFKYLGEG